LRSCGSPAFTEKIAMLNGRLEIVFLPAYSPQLNPDEGVWARVKREVGEQIVLTKDDLLKKGPQRIG
jgi:transposase